jgi:hypothetical protein
MTRLLARALLGAAVATAVATAAIGQTMTVPLSALAEKPKPGDRRASGVATVQLLTLKSQVCYKIEAKDLAPVVMAHIHKGSPDVAGPVVVTLANPDASGKSAGCLAIPLSLALDIAHYPRGYYLNLHTKEFPDGAIRGQLAH